MSTLKQRKLMGNESYAASDVEHLTYMIICRKLSHPVTFSTVLQARWHSKCSSLLVSNGGDL